MRLQMLEYKFEPRLSDPAADWPMLAPFTIHLSLSYVIAEMQRSIIGYEAHVRKFSSLELPPGPRRRYIEEQSILEWLLLQSATGVPNLQWDLAHPDHLFRI